MGLGLLSLGVKAAGGPPGLARRGVFRRRTSRIGNTIEESGDLLRVEFALFSVRRIWARRLLTGPFLTRLRTGRLRTRRRLMFEQVRDPVRLGRFGWLGFGWRWRGDLRRRRSGRRLPRRRRGLRRWPGRLCVRFFFGLLLCFVEFFLRRFDRRRRLSIGDARLQPSELGGRHDVYRNDQLLCLFWLNVARITG
jgi:hypothetical protein